MSTVSTVISVLGHAALFITSVVLWVHLAADVLRLRDVAGLPDAMSTAWLQLLKTALLLGVVMLIALRFDSAAPMWALAWALAIRTLAWLGLRIALKAGLRAQVDETLATGRSADPTQHD